MHLGPQIPTILSGQRGTHFIERRSAHDDGEGVVVANPHSLEVIYIPKNPPPPHTPRPKAAKRIPYSTIESLVPIESSCSGRTRTFAISETPSLGRIVRIASEPAGARLRDTRSLVRILHTL